MQSPEVIIGFTAEIRRACGDPRGFTDAKYQFSLQQPTPLFGESRWRGYAAMLRRYENATLVIAGGQEQRIPGVGRAAAMKRQIEEIEGILPERVTAIDTTGNSRGALDIMLGFVNNPNVNPSVVVASNFYHLPRLALFLWQRQQLLPALPAEGYLFLEDPARALRICHDQMSKKKVFRRQMVEMEGIIAAYEGRYQIK